jgi:hypothetical protein
MADFKNIELKYCDRGVAKQVCEKNHYMKTYPQGAKVNIALTDNNKIVGIVVFGYSSQTTKKVLKIAYGLEKKQFLEMQRLWINDDYGHNTESYILAKVIQKLKTDYDLQLVVTHAGGCKDDCGIVYQASGWLYFGSTECSDFFETKAGEYKNIIAPMRFGRIDAKNKTPQEVGVELFGEGQIVNAHRYFYAYPINKGMRRRLSKIGLPFPKTSANFRKNQEWVKQGGFAGASGESRSGSNPLASTGK